MKLLPRTLLDELAARAHASPRRRAHHNVHADASDPVQRFFVVVDRDSYVRPHRHRTRSELALVLRGCFDVVTFDDRGVVGARYAVGESTPQMGYELPPDTWHTLIARQDGSAFLEIKQGPYDPATSAEFAPWAPAEGDALAQRFVRWARGAVPGSVATHIE